MFSLPTSDSPLRQLFDVADLVPMLRPDNRSSLPTFRQSHLSAKNFFASDRSARAIHCVIVRADGKVWLVQFGPRGGWKKLWEFGKL